MQNQNQNLLFFIDMPWKLDVIWILDTTHLVNIVVLLHSKAVSKFSVAKATLELAMSVRSSVRLSH